MEPDDQFPGFQILGELSNTGAMVVYKASDLQRNRLVALKSCRSVDPLEQKRFIRAVQCMAAVQHPCIVSPYSIEWRGGFGYMTMELVEGGRLADRFGSPWPAHQAASLMAELTNAVQSLHERGIIHRQIDATHVLFTLESRPKLAGFGRAMAVDDASLPCKTTRATTAADISALGAIFYELLTGHPPFRTKQAAEALAEPLHEIPVPPTHFVPEVSSELATICMKCMASNPEIRYANVGALAEELRRFVQGLSNTTTTPVRRGWRWLFRRD